MPGAETTFFTIFIYLPLNELVKSLKQLHGAEAAPGINMAESRRPKTAEGCSTNVGWAKKANNEGKLTLPLPLLQDLFHSCKLSGSSFMHRCSHKGAKCRRQGVTKPKNERHKCIIHAESLQCSMIPFFRADRSAINFGYMILYF